MVDTFFLNNEIAKIVGERYARGEIRKVYEAANIDQSLFSKYMKSIRKMTDKTAMEILIACDYKLSEAKKIIAEIKAKEALKSLSAKDRSEVLNKIVAGDNSIVITGDNNSVHSRLDRMYKDVRNEDGMPSADEVLQSKSPY